MITLDSINSLPADEYLTLLAVLANAAGIDSSLHLSSYDVFTFFIKLRVLDIANMVTDDQTVILSTLRKLL